MSTRGRLSDITSAVVNSPDPPAFQRRKPLPISNALLGNPTSRNHSPPSSSNVMMPTRSSRAQQQPGSNPKSPRTTPSFLKSAGSKRKASTLIASASKMLKPNNSNKCESTSTRSQSASPNALIRLNNNTIPIKRKPLLSSNLPQPLPARRSPPPADKPLPSLPVATIVTKLPIQRRSLIDATERPLRRSISPQTGEEGEEEWPALSPERPPIQQARGHRQYDPRLFKPVKPSLGESFIEGLRQLDIQDPEDAPILRQESESNKENVLSRTAETLDAKLAPENITPKTEDFPAPPVSSSPVKPTGYRKQGQKAAPVIRHTKTSAMRIRLSTGSVEEVDQHVEKQSKLTDTTTTDRVSRSAVRKGDSTTTAGPVRSKSRMRHMATGRGSPYTLASRSGSRPSEDLRHRKTSRSAPSISERPESASTDSFSSVRLGHPVAVKERGSDSGKRKTSIPLPSRLIRHFLDEDSEAEIPSFKHRKGFSLSVERRTDSSDADVDTDHVPEITSSAKTSASQLRFTPSPGGLLQQPSSALLTFSELMATPAPSERELNSENESVQGSIHGHDEGGGFKIKKLRGRASQGATLRISDSAKHLLAPRDDDDDGDQEVAELRNNVVLKDHLRKSSDLIKSQIQLTRSITEKSLARFSGIAAIQTRGISRSYSSDPEDVESSSIIVRRESCNGGKSENNSVDNKLHQETSPSKDDDLPDDTPSSISQGDWPLKDFKSLASASKGHSAQESVDSSWIPPADWEIRKSPELDLSSPSVPGPENTVVTTAARRNHFSSPVPPFRRPPQPSAEADADSKIPPRTLEKDSIFKRKFPPRTTSIQKVPQFALSSRDRKLSPVHETIERKSVARLPRKSDGPSYSKVAQPASTRSFTQNIRDIDDGFNAMKKPTPHSKGILKSTGNKSMSTIRSLFHKKSGEIRGSFRVKRTRPTFDLGQISSPIPPTPTPLPNAIPTGESALNAKSTLMPAKAAATLGEHPIPASAPAKLATHLIEPDEIRHATQTALQVLEMARIEPPGPRQDQLVQLGKATVEVINAARNAEKALEQAKGAVTKTEMYAVTCNQAVADVGALVEKLLE